MNEPLLPNQAPDTEIFLFADDPDSLNQQKSRLSVHWWGDDPDGLVLGYYFRWVGVSPQWTFTPLNDSLFSLPIGSADTIYTFEVAAVDVEGNNVTIGEKENVCTLTKEQFEILKEKIKNDEI